MKAWAWQGAGHNVPPESALMTNVSTVSPLSQTHHSSQLYAYYLDTLIHYVDFEIVRLNIDIYFTTVNF